ncbi:hypothetical protein DSO57_1004147 [Entomophthora muscae]|uniref:Uncharacterized protein n=1 Tax=Entomophthora muscae TaxID=34485 RepID=A0ACC2UH66_9FUNG|nr:hypothetical protein DSO57_1004147 [Entomophthora muscae]
MAMIEYCFSVKPCTKDCDSNKVFASPKEGTSIYSESINSVSILEKVSKLETDLSVMKSSFHELESKLSQSRSPVESIKTEEVTDVASTNGSIYEEKLPINLFRDPFDSPCSKKNTTIRSSIDKKTSKAKLTKVKSMALLDSINMTVSDKKTRKPRPVSTATGLVLSLDSEKTLAPPRLKERRSSLGSTLEKISLSQDIEEACHDQPRSLIEAQRIKFDRIFDGTTSFRLFRILFESTFTRCPGSVLIALLLTHVTDNVRAYMLPLLEKDYSWEKICAKLEVKFDGQRSLQLLWFKFMELEFGLGETIQSFVDRFELIAQTLLAAKTIGIQDVKTVILRAVEPFHALSFHCQSSLGTAESLKEIIDILLEAEVLIGKDHVL